MTTTHLRQTTGTHPPRTLLATAVALLATLVLGGAARAQEPGQAALAFVFDDGHVASRCVPIEEREGGFTGADLLDRSGLAVVIDASSGMGITVCQVEALGCPYPAKPCFCQCMSGSKCAYWNYFYRDPGQAEWVYSPLGARLRQVQPGTIEVWVWGDGATPPPDDLTFESICRLVTATMTQVSAAPANPPRAAASTTATPVAPASTRAVSTPGVPAPAPTATPPSPPSPSPTSAAPVPDAGAPSGWSTYLLFGLILLALAAIGLFARWRRTQGA